MNEKARRQRVLPGQRYAAALALATELDVGTVSVAKIEDRVGFITDLLRRFSPEVEPAHHEPGVFWMNARGLGRLYPSLEKWSDAVQAALKKAGLKRFGIEAHRLHRLASGKVCTPLQPEAPAEPRQRQAQLEAPESNAERLLFLIKPLLDSLLKEMSSKAEALTELTLHLHLEDIGERKERIRPAAPTTDSAQILGLVRLRMESLELARGVTELTLIAGW